MRRQPASGGPRSRQPTIADVGRAARVSRQTVSNVINAPERVRPATRETVERAINLLGYRTNRLARNLKHRSSRLFGYRIPEAQHAAQAPILDRFLHALTGAAREEGYHLLLFVPRTGGDESAAHDEMVGTQTVDGLIISDTTPHDERIEFLVRQGTPFVAFGRTELTLPYAWVDVDGAAGTRLAVDHLVRNGHRRIAYVSETPVRTYISDRLRGYREGLEAHGLQVDPGLTVVGGEGPVAGAEALRALRALDDPPTAIVTGTDLLAVGVMEAARARDIPLGRNGLAVVGFDDRPFAAYLDPPLTTLRQPIEQAAHEIVRLLLAQLRGEPARSVLLAPQLVIRQSA